jgi:hypothetical protein
MRSKTFLFLSVLAAALAACDRQTNTPPAGAGTTAPPASAAYPTQDSNLGQPNAAEKKHGANPVQGQVDPKQSEQHRDFQQKGDARGPTSPETTPPGPKR